MKLDPDKTPAGPAVAARSIGAPGTAQPAKPFWQSKTFWGALAAAVPSAMSILTVAGVPVPPGLTEAVLGLLGSVFAVYGRAKAQNAISMKSSGWQPPTDPTRTGGPEMTGNPFRLD